MSASPTLYEKIVQDIDSQGWSHCLNVLSTSELRELNQFFDEHRGEFVPAKVGPRHDNRRDETIRGDYTRWVNEEESIFRSPFALVDGLKVHLNQSLFLGLKDMELHLAYYPPGYFYQKHLDRFESGSSRTLSVVFYLHEEWREHDGGELVLFDKKNTELKTILPLPGSLAVFLSEDFPHEVRKCFKERRSLTGWIHNRSLGVL